MKINFTDENEEVQTLILRDDGKWISSKGDKAKELASVLNEAFVFWIGHFEYYPTPWHQAKAVADKLAKEDPTVTLDPPSPPAPLESKKGRVY